MTRSQKYRLRYVLGDLLGVIVGTYLFHICRYEVEELVFSWGSLLHYLTTPKMCAVSLVIVLFWLGLFALSGYYNKPLAKSRLEELFLTASVVMIGSGLQFLFLVVDDEMTDPSLLVRLFAMLYGVMLCAVYPLRVIHTTRSVRAERHSENWQKAFVIGTETRIQALLQDQKELHFVPVGTWTVGEWGFSWEAMHEAFLASTTPPEAIYVAIDEEHIPLLHQLFYRLYAFHLPIKITVDDMMGYAPRIRRPLLWGTPLVDITESHMKEWERNVKWLFDRLFALLAIVLLLPVYLTIALLVKCSDPLAPIFFWQERIGKKGKPFKIVKFRTMRPNAEADGPRLSSTNDDRVTAIGRYMRKYRIDELPQFYNVLRGDMSIVGPRPERAFYIRQILDKAPHYYLLHNVLPGITSWGMVRYGYASNLDEMLERFRYDWLYYENMSLRLDIQVLLYTISTLIKGKGK